ncbi:MAG: NAD-dependent protein deacylase [Bryobacteraceae bacterium]|nr:MAG: NAD-dependent protein deacylase [Bryobacteraceae bacterium]
MTPDIAIQQARQWLEEATRVAALTGSGISAESGIPTFRGADGLWRRLRAEELATPEAFARDPKLVWEWYDWRRALIAQARPNLAHYALAALEQRLGDRFMLITQNVDGLHNRAGSQRVLKLHGDIWWTLCTACQDVRSDFRVPLPELPPRCEKCGGMLRPAVVWFGEPLPERTWQQAEEAVRACDVLIVAGTSAVVYPAASLAPLAKRHGARIIEVNLEDTPLSSLADLALRGACGELLPRIIES